MWPVKASFHFISFKQTGNAEQNRQQKPASRSGEGCGEEKEEKETILVDSSKEDKSLSWLTYLRSSWSQKAIFSFHPLEQQIVQTVTEQHKSSSINTRHTAEKRANLEGMSSACCRLELGHRAVSSEKTVLTLLWVFSESLSGKDMTCSLQTRACLRDSLLPILHICPVPPLI